LDPQRPDDFRRLLVEVTAEDRPLQGAVYLWAAQAGGGEEVAVEALTAGQTQYAGGALHLMQALAQTPARLWLVTRGAQPLDDRPVRVAQATLWGLGRVMALEYSEQWGGLIDLGDDPPSEEAEKLWREIGAAAGTYE